MITKKIENIFLSLLSNIKKGSINITTPDGKVHEYKGEQQGSDCDLLIRNAKFYYYLLATLDTGFAKSYSKGYCDTSDLVALFVFVLDNNEDIKKLYNNHRLSNFLLRIFYRLKANTVRGSKKNILAHYDIGNEFYGQWLDKTLTYSSGLFLETANTLTQAQNNKYERIYNQLRDSKNILEIGCGWGGFIDYVILNSSSHITGLTISDQQYQYVGEKFKEHTNIKLILQDYRHHYGQYDGIVSIEMIEAVGERYWPVYFEKIKKCLNDSGTALIQAILIDDQYFDEYRKSGDFIRSMIFPGGMLLSKQKVYELAYDCGLAIRDFYTFGDSYALTLEHWLKNFDVSEQFVHHNQSFVKLWRTYLAYCIAGFKAQRITVAQITMDHQS